MDYVSALLPPVVMAIFFIGVIRVIVKTQGGANKAKEDAAVDAALARVEGTRQPSTTPPQAPQADA
ncbi:membrane protein [Streptomyces venetus]|uniref:Membrane protein n=1 Tax=Streptomyces venetus TaxID=1701086 RepID=A0ABP8HKH9_9ACTN